MIRPNALVNRVHRSRVSAALAVLALLALVAVPSSALPPDPGWPRGLITNRPGALDGYTMFSPLSQEATYLVDMDGKVVHQWSHENIPGLYQYLNEDGSLVRAGRVRHDTRFRRGLGLGGVIEQLGWDGDVLWRFEYADETHHQHHDVEMLPDGNVLLLAWEYRSEEEAIAAGRDPDLLPDGEVWPDTVVEYSPSKDAIVWKWSVWDHLIQDFDRSKANYGDVAATPEKVDVNFSPEQALQTPGEADWNHANAVDYNADLDQIVISLRSFSEIWVIDHDTTTEEARGSAGDLLFRFGNPAAYRQGTQRDQVLFAQHDAEWIADDLPGAGRLLVFNNGLSGQRQYSSVDEIVPETAGTTYALDHGEFAARMKRVYPLRKDDRVFAAIISGAERLENGNTLITYGTHGLILEVTTKGKLVWKYEVPYFSVRPQTPMGNINFVIKPWRTFRAERYPSDYPAFEGRTLES